MSGNNINSFAENMRRTITAQTNALSLLESIQKSISTKDTVVQYDYENLKDSSITSYQLPSYTAVNNRLKALERNMSNLSAGRSTLELNDGSRRQIVLTNLPQTPNRITGVQTPTEFKIDSNWFFEDLMFPGLTVSLDLTSQIEDSADRVKLSRIILDANNEKTQQFWNNNLANNQYTYVSLKAVLAYNGIQYSEDIEEIQLPLVSNTVAGSFQIMYDPEIINGNTWYTFDTLTYTSIDENGENIGKNNILSVGDRLAYNDTLYSIIDVDQNNNKVRLKILSGSEFPGVYSLFRIYQDPFRRKVINVRIGAHEYDLIYIKGVNEAFNLLSNEWSDPIQFATDELVQDIDANINLRQYYSQFVSDWGAQWIAESKERRLSAYYGHIPNAPSISATDLRVVQINTQVNAALDNNDLKNLASDIESTRTLIESLQKTIASQKTELLGEKTADEYNKIQDEIAQNTKNLEIQQTQYTSLVKRFQSSVQENKAVVENPKYHIRGFFPLPQPRYRDEENTIPEEVIGFDIAYRYICEDNTGVQLNTFNYTDTDGNTIITGTFTDWISVQSALKQRVFNPETQMFDWKIENVADGSEININQIDIPITKGEKVEIKIRSISEAGYPDNPLKSDWSESVTISFPDNLNTNNAMAELVQEVNDDALHIAIRSDLNAVGLIAHMNDSIANENSVSGVFCHHTAENIAFEETIPSGGVETINIQNKIEDLEARIQLLEAYIDAQTNAVMDIN